MFVRNGRQGRESDANRDNPMRAAPMRYFQRADGRRNSLAHDNGTLLIRVGKESRYFLAAISCYDILWPLTCCRYSVGDRFEDSIPLKVSIFIVEVLEAIDINHGHR